MEAISLTEPISEHLGKASPKLWICRSDGHDLRLRNPGRDRVLDRSYGGAPARFGIDGGHLSDVCTSGTVGDDVSVDDDLDLARENKRHFVGDRTLYDEHVSDCMLTHFSNVGQRCRQVMLATQDLLIQKTLQEAALAVCTFEARLHSIDQR
jgi:hypothetical protein